MMKRVSLLLIVLSIWTEVVRAQKYDYNWVSGIPINQSAMLKFNEGGIIGMDTILPGIYTAMGNVTISDNEGKMRFYTNGNYIADSSHQLMTNSLGLNEGSPWRGGKSQPFFSYCILCYQVIPDGYNEGVYYLIHPLMIQASNPGFLISSTKIYMTKINMNRNNGLGEVIYKNQAILTEETSPIFKTVQHGNGKDWWIILRSVDGKYYHTLLMSSDKVLLSEKQFNINSEPLLKHIKDSISTSQFGFDVSYSGSYIIENIGSVQQRLLSFDRCTGEITFVKEFYVPTETYPGDPGETEVYLFAISPNDQFAYGWGLNGLYQWDLTAEDIAKSKVKIFGPPLVIEVNEENTDDPIELMPPAYGPDGKLYFLKYFNHYVVHNPDARGLAANAEGPRALPVRLPLHSPNYPNYRLGPLKGSPCDSLSTNSEDRYRNSSFKVYPNPASGSFTIELDLPEWGAEDVTIRIFDAVGRELYRHPYARWAFRHQVEAGHLPPGAYHIRLEIGRAVVHTERLVVY